MSNWYYADHQRQSHGPMDQDAVVHAFNNGHITLDTLIWREGMAQWQPLSEVAGELGLSAQLPEPSPPPIPVAVTPESGTHTPTTGTPAIAPITWPANQTQHDTNAFAISTSAPGARHPFSASNDVQAGEVVYAGFWKRVAAYLIDGLVVGVVSGIIAAILGGTIGVLFGIGRRITSADTIVLQVVIQAISLILTASYYGYFHSSTNQATLGKMAVGIKVVDNHGNSISFLRGFGRYFALLLSAMTLSIGFLMAAFTDRKRALHDMICDTLVVDRWAFTDHPERQRRELGGLTLTILIVFGLLLLLALLIMGVALYFVGRYNGG